MQMISFYNFIQLQHLRTGSIFFEISFLFMKKQLLIPITILSCLVGFAQVSDSTSNSGKTNLEQNINDTTIYTEVDSLAVFPGGRPAWIKYVERTLNPAIGIMNGAKKGTYNVVIRFTVTKEGKLKDFVPLTKYKHGFEDEVIRILKLSPNWIPAIKNGVYVNSTIEQMQVFIISKGR